MRGEPGDGHWTCPGCGRPVPRDVPDTFSHVHRLIRRHLHHHDFIRDLKQPAGRAASLCRAIADRKVPKGDQAFLGHLFDPDGMGDDFPLLILHGFADRRASRGQADDTCFELMGADRPAPPRDARPPSGSPRRPRRLARSSCRS